jgi:aminoglycoside phosphotransferase (APT) family kinase protein
MPGKHEQEIVLKGGNENVVVQVGDTVRRPVHPWTPAVHALLRQLEEAGFEEAPRVLGFDAQGREILTMIEGEVGNYPTTPEMQSERSLIAAAHMLRRYHNAATIQPGWGDLPWRYRNPDPARWEVICHSDVAPYNIVYRGGGPVGLIDFDVAGPGPRLWDVAYAAFRLVPLSGDDSCRSFGFADPPDRVARLGVFLDAYGLDDRSGVLEMAITRIEGLRDDIVGRAAAGDRLICTGAMSLRPDRTSKRVR